MQNISPISKDELYIKNIEMKMKKIDGEVCVLKKINAENEEKLTKMASLEEKVRNYQERIKTVDTFKHKAQIQKDEI